MSVLHRHGSHSRGPQRSRWERKHSPVSRSYLVLLACLVVTSCFGYSIWRTCSSSDASLLTTSDSIPKQYSSLRKRADPISLFEKKQPVADAIVVGSGLAGLTTALTILDRGGTVYVIEKEPVLGGNSNKASSGINACCLEQDQGRNNDTIQLFIEDTVESAGQSAQLDLIETLVGGSASAITWLQQRLSVDLSALVQLGGHSRKRTHRPVDGMVGVTLMSALASAVQEYVSSGKAKVLLETKVVRVLKNTDGAVRGVETRLTDVFQSTTKLIRSDAVVLATGGFASDRSNGSLLERYRPELMRMPATAGPFSTGDGVRMATSIGANTVDMEKVQLHPTGFVDPSDSDNVNKVLAAELLRGVGGILLNHRGQRFCNELGTRSYVTDKMLEHDTEYASRHKWNAQSQVPTFYLVLSSVAARDAEKHVGMYVREGLMVKVSGMVNLASHIGVSLQDLEASLNLYRSASESLEDEFGKSVFNNVPPANPSQEEFYVGIVTPVLHYCMGGITINTQGQMLDKQGIPIEGLWGAGEVTGGVHGDNRLGGNSLLECAVYGSVVGMNLPVNSYPIPPDETGMAGQGKKKLQLSIALLTKDDVAQHSVPEDCYVALHGYVFDLTDFAAHHPGGKRSIQSLCGTDGTVTFSGIHAVKILNGVQTYLIGQLPADEVVNVTPTILQKTKVTEKELQKHNTPEDCWVILHGDVYDLTEFSKGHKGGAYSIQKYAGQDATNSFQVFHKPEKLSLVEHLKVGSFES
eukprot:Nitzschia sp. Nitz4//scaffold287_size23745//1466//3721//NITZ4_008456-RA/size23745-processed-gene-0.30-mRNA-1//1//CDS//3329545757//5478//frame0